MNIGWVGQDGNKFTMYCEKEQLVWPRCAGNCTTFGRLNPSVN